MSYPLALALLLFFARATSGNYCAQQDDCSSCTRANTDDGEDSACAWCFSTGKCKLAYSKSEPKVGDWLTGPGTCPVYTTSRATCKCQPTKYTTCETCTKNHPGCVWVKNATSYVTTIVQLPLFGPRTTTLKHTWENLCWAGNGIAGPNFAQTEVAGNDIKMSARRTAPPPRMTVGRLALLLSALSFAHVATSPPANGQPHFADLLRDAAPYIAMHRDSAMVIHIPGEAIERAAEFAAIMDDIALLNLLGVQLVIVVGLRAQIDARLDQIGWQKRFVGATRITDAQTMRIVKEVAGFARSEVESALARGLTRISWASTPPMSNGNGLAAPPPQPASEQYRLDPATRLELMDDPAFGRMRRKGTGPPLPAPRADGDPPPPPPPPPPAPRPLSGGGDATFAPRPLRGVEVVSSNNLFTARPIGVRGGIDFGYSGEVRKVNRETISELLRRDWVVLMVPLGYSASGEVYNCNSQELACETAAQIGATKLILYTPESWSVRMAGMVASATAEAAAAAAFHGPAQAAAMGRSPASAALDAEPAEAAAIWSSLTRAVVEAYRKWQRENTAADLLRLRDSQRKAKQLLREGVLQEQQAREGLGAAEPLSSVVSSVPTLPPGPLGEGAAALAQPLPRAPAGPRPRLAPLTDGGGRELSVWTVHDGEGNVEGGSGGAFEALEAGEGGDSRVRLCIKTQAEFVLLCSWSVRALSKGVRRAHLIEPRGGQVLEELYTSAGTGMLIARDVYEGFRAASAGDIPQIVELIAPLEEQGILTRRGRSVIEADVERGLFHVLERDGQVLACAILKPIPDASAPPALPSPGEAVSALPLLPEGGDSYTAARVAAVAAAAAAAAHPANTEWAELGCLAVNQKFRNLGRGEAMLGYLQRIALKQGVRYLFCLSTHTMQWFVERGFKEVPLAQLPESRIQAFNWKRNSKCFAKTLSSDRDLDAQELFWGA
ncbi:hypothetical protein T492DRAFT_909225 [Pavlovales sp. CCMP2436]|nr:hypothetical protein T492DRAFT_909225 [Pavlovales sp. CCMP2436]